MKDLNEKIREYFEREVNFINVTDGMWGTDLLKARVCTCSL